MDLESLENSTLIADLPILLERHVRPIIVAPDAQSAREIVRTMNRSENRAVALSGSDGALLPGNSGNLGNVQTALLNTLTENGFVPVIEPTAFCAFGNDATIAADDVACAIASATEAVRAIFFHALGGVPDPKTAELIAELTPAEALAIADEPTLPNDLAGAIRAAALGVRRGVAAAQILDGRLAHAAVVELLTATHLGTQVSGSIFAAG